MKYTLGCVRKADEDFSLIQPGDFVAVGVSGGKDSMLCLEALRLYQLFSHKQYSLCAITVDPGYGFDPSPLSSYCKEHEIPFYFAPGAVVETANSLAKPGKSPCSLCAKMRRGALNAKAKELGCNKIALGHHIDDVVETILMGMFYGSQIQTMMPKLHSTNFEGMELIRPMYLIEEKDIIHWCHYNDLAFIQCACRFTEEMEELGDVHHTSKREEMKNLIKYLETMNPNVKKNVFKSMENVKLGTVIAYSDDEGEHHFLEKYNKEVR